MAQRKKGKRISLYPLGFEEALKGLLQIKPGRERAMSFKQGQRVKYKGGSARNVPSTVNVDTKGIVLEIGGDEVSPVPTYLVRFDGMSQPLWIEATALTSL